MNYGTEIKSRRLARGWTQSELAQRCELTLRTIQRLEKGRVNPSLFTQSKLQEVLNMRWESEDQDPDFTINQSFNLTFSKTMKPILQFLQPKLLLLLGLALLGLITLPWSQELGPVSSSDPVSFERRNLEIQTINCGFKSECDIEVTRKNAVGEILWQKTYGGSSYDRGAAVLETQDGGALILGSTSSFGAGNYDILLIKTDAIGEVLWQRTYGGFFNEYGKNIRYGETQEFLIIEGTRQICKSPNVSADCLMEIWNFTIDQNGQDQKRGNEGMISLAQRPG